MQDMEKDYLETTRKNLLLAFVLVVIIIIVALLFSGPKQARVPKLINSQTVVSKEENIVKNTFEVRQIKKDDKYVNFDIKYPYFFYTGPDFNNEIKDFVETQVEAHSITSKEAWQARYQNRTDEYDISKFPKNNDEKFYFFSDFEVVQSNSSYVSVVIHYGGFGGGAHGYENIVSFSYDIKNKKKIELIDLFAGEANYLSFLSEYSRKHFKELLEEKIKETFTEKDDKNAVQDYVTNYIMMIEGGTKPTKENFSVFSFTKDKIVIYFGQYQVGPYSDGMHELEILR